MTPESSEHASAPRSGVINSAAYSNGVRVAVVPIPDLGDAWRHSDRFLWVGLYEPSEPLLAHIQQAFGLHDLAIEDAHQAHQRPKLEIYDDSMFVVLRTAQLCADGEHRIEFGETHVFVGSRYVVTVRHGSLQSHVGLRSRCEASPQMLAKGEGFVLHALMDFIVDKYFPILDESGDHAGSGRRRRLTSTAPNCSIQRWFPAASRFTQYQKCARATELNRGDSTAWLMDRELSSGSSAVAPR